VYNSRKSTILTIIAILFLGTAIRAYRLGHQSLWFDEILTYHSASDSILQILTQPSVNTNILPLYYLVVHGILRIGNQDALLRLPSVIFGSLSILLFYFVVRNWLGRTIALISASLMAISPFHVWYSQEARPYVLLLFLALLSLWLFQKLITKGTNLWLRIGFIISTASTFYCHTVAIAFFIFLGTYVLMVVPGKKWKEWLPVFGCILLLLLPGIYRTFLFPPDNPADPERLFNLLSIPYAIWTFSTGYSLGPTVSELHMPDTIKHVSQNIHIILPLMLLFGILFVLGIFTLWNKNRQIFWIITVCFIFPLVFVILGSIFTSHPFNVRYAIISFAPYIVFLAMGVQSLKVKWVPTVILTILLGISALSLSNYFFNEQFHRDNTRAAGQFLSAHAQTNDLIICNAPYTATTLLYYYNGKNHLNFAGYPADTRYVKSSKLKSDFKNLLGDRDHFWLFLSRTFHSDPYGYTHKYCDENFRRVIELKRSGAELILYEQ
jgi:uncharacterized membrane protein